MVDVDLPKTDQTPRDPGEALAKTIGRERFEAGGGRLKGMEYQADTMYATLMGAADGPISLSWGAIATSSVSAENDAPCDPEDYVTCGTRVVAGDKVQVKWEYRAAGASVKLQYDGPINRVFSRVTYSGKAGTGTPDVPFEALAGLVHDPRWQQ